MEWKTVQKARERINTEENSVTKDWGGLTSIALIYPNTYYVGMSNLGFQSVYATLNRHPQIVCERVFYDEGEEPLGTESQRPLTDFDVLAFSLSFEMDYFNIANILRSGGIPVFSSEREQYHPIIIAGGAAITANPAPLTDLIDAFAIGEAEAILPQMTQTLINAIDEKKGDILTKLSDVPGIYVPGISTNPVERQIADITRFNTHSEVLTPDTELGDLYLLEIARGCARGCRFCLAGYHFRPARYRPVEMLLEQIHEGSKHKKRMGLISAAVSDYPQIDELVVGIRKMDLKFSVSSIRIKPLSEVLLKGLAESGTRTVALAPEAGSKRLRQVISKGISENDILKAVDMVTAQGLKQIKLYFMIGLPTETEEDIIDIVNLIQKAKDVAGKHRSGIQFTLNVTSFVPKAGTPFQWQPMATAADLKHRLSLLQNQLRDKGIQIKADSVEQALIQGMLARGSADMGKVIAGIGPKLSYAAWKKQLKKAGIDAEAIHQAIPTDAQLPWSMIDSGTDTKKLLDEMEKAFKK